MIRKVISILSVLLLSTFVVGCKKEVPFKDNLKIELGNAISLDVANYLSDDLDQKDKDHIIKTAKLSVINNKRVQGELYQPVGQYNIKINYNNHDYKIKVDVVDTTKPEFVDFKDSLSIYKGDTIDFKSIYNLKDLSKAVLSYDDSHIDYNKAGCYKLNLSATDSYDNVLCKEVLIEILEPSLTINSSSYNVFEGENFVIKPLIKGKNEQAIFKSSDPNIASVSDTGEVNGKKAGKVIISISANGLIKECNVTIKALPKHSKPDNKPINKPINKPVDKPVTKPDSSNSTPIINNQGFNLSKAKEAFHLHNVERSKHQLNSLAWSDELYKATQIRAKEVFQIYKDTKKLSHNRLDGSPFYTVLSSYNSCGENIAAGFSDSKSVVNAWMNSPGHRSNILGKYTQMAVAYYDGCWVVIFRN